MSFKGEGFEKTQGLTFPHIDSLIRQHQIFKSGGEAGGGV